MTKLEKLYSIIENSREVGVKLSKDVLQQVEELEEGIIKEEILPALGNDIAPRLEPIKRDLVLVVEYHPGEPISVALSRKTKISEIMGAKTLTPRSSTPVKSDEEPQEIAPHEPTKHIENTTKGMRVIFPDGTVIWHRQAIDTFVETLRKIGLERIHELGIEHGNGFNLVSREKRPPVPGRIWQHECDGWYIYSNISNGTKKEDLQRISDYYHLRLKIEEGKPEQNPDRSTLLFLVREQDFNRSIREIYDFLQGAEINKRSSLRDRSIEIKNAGIVSYRSINHDDIYSWKQTINTYKQYR